MEIYWNIQFCCATLSPITVLLRRFFTLLAVRMTWRILNNEIRKKVMSQINKCHNARAYRKFLVSSNHPAAAVLRCSSSRVICILEWWTDNSCTLIQCQLVSYSSVHRLTAPVLVTWRLARTSALSCSIWRVIEVSLHRASRVHVVARSKDEGGDLMR